jgi:hypothetical protein
VSPTRRRSSRSSSRRKPTSRRDFWDGVRRDDGDDHEPVIPVRAPEDASAMIRSLGPPPLPGRETIAERYFALAYDKASRRAVALAAASGLIDFSESDD